MNLRSSVLVAVVCGILTGSAPAAFHLMQIEELIGGVAGNNTAQAIELRMRSDFQNSVTGTRVRAWDATGGNPILLGTLTSSVIGGAGRRILLATPAFDSLMSSVAGYHHDFALTTPIPASYLNAGKVTFEDSGGTIYWAVAFGGASYTGSNTGSMFNDSDGIFGPAFASALPTDALRGVRFSGIAGDPSTNNAANYALSPNPTTVFSNDNLSYTVVPEPASVSFVVIGAAALGGIMLRRRRA